MPEYSERIFNVVDFGAVGDGASDDTHAFNSASDACACSGGGVVLAPPGSFIISTVLLHSNTTLLVQAGATLLGHHDPGAYRTFSRVGEDKPNRWNRSMILCDNSQNVNITGGGVIDGSHVFDPEGEEKMRGPHTVMLHNSNNISISNITIRNSANYAIMFYDSSAIRIDKIQVEAGWDGVHFRGRENLPCRDVSITNSQFYTGDDSIAGCYWENVTISGCILNSSCNAIRLIGPALGLIIHDCLIYGPGRHEHRTSGNKNSLVGINLQPGAWTKTTGSMDDVLISRITMHRVQTPFHIVLKPSNSGGKVDISSVDAHGVYFAASSVENWGDEKFESVTFRDVSIECLETCSISPDEPAVNPPHVGARRLPAWGLYARNIESLRIENLRLSIPGKPETPAVVMDNIHSLSVDNLRLPLGSNHDNSLILHDVGIFTEPYAGSFRNAT